MLEPAREGVTYTDGDDDNRVPPRFTQLLREVDGRAAAGGSLTVVFSDITRLVRSWRALDAVRERVMAGHMDLLCARQGESDLAAADLLGLAELSAFAYDGPRHPLKATLRLASIDGYIERWLVPWLRGCGAVDDQLQLVRADVGARLRSLAWRWDQPRERDWLIGAVREVAESHRPEGLPVLVRAAALVGVRNSVLEDLHVAEPPVIKQYDWKVITQAAAWYLAEFDHAQPGAQPDDDPFAGLAAARPAAAAALSALASISVGEETTFAIPEGHVADAPASDRVVPLTHDGFEVMNAMDPQIGQYSADVYARVIAEQIPFVVPSLKHISRNPAKLMRVLDSLLMHGVRVLTANADIHDGRVIRRDELVDYNDTDMSWAGFGDMLAARPKVGRNDPCPCGSGQKYKRCCGR
jgi:SEC-C motif-containing protein